MFSLAFQVIFYVRDFPQNAENSNPGWVRKVQKEGFVFEAQHKKWEQGGKKWDNHTVARRCLWLVAALLWLCWLAGWLVAAFVDSLVCCSPSRLSSTFLYLQLIELRRISTSYVDLPQFQHIMNRADCLLLLGAALFADMADDLKFDEMHHSVIGL